MCSCLDKLKILQNNDGYVKNITAIKICRDWIIEQLSKGLSYAEMTKLFYGFLEENNIKVDKKVDNSIYFYIKRNNLESKIKKLND